MSVKFGLWTFHELSELQKNFYFIDIWLPYLLRLSSQLTVESCRDS